MSNKTDAKTINVYFIGGNKKTLVGKYKTKAAADKAARKHYEEKQKHTFGGIYRIEKE